MIHSAGVIKLIDCALSLLYVRLIAAWLPSLILFSIPPLIGAAAAECVVPPRNYCLSLNRAARSGRTEEGGRPMQWDGIDFFLLYRARALLEILPMHYYTPFNFSPSLIDNFVLIEATGNVSLSPFAGHSTPSRATQPLRGPLILFADHSTPSRATQPLRGPRDPFAGYSPL